jgi:hypothetical protein
MGAEQPKDPRPAPAAEPSKPSGKLRTRIVARPGHGIIVVGLGSGALMKAWGDRRRRRRTPPTVRRPRGDTP